MNSNYLTCSNCSSSGKVLSLVLTALSLTGSAILGSLASTMAVVLLVAGSLNSNPANAQTTPAAPNSDINPPVIELETIDSGVAGQDQVFTALVAADNSNLLDVKLYYRYMGQQAYQNVLMEPLAADTDFYLATLTTDPEDTRTIEYYVQARDTAGNRVVEGFAFEPLLRTLTAAQTGTESFGEETVVTADPGPQFETEAPSSGGIKLWHIVVGVLAVGAIAAVAASGGGGDGGGGNPDNPSPQTVPLTITIGTP